MNDYNINIEKERIEIPIYFSHKIDEEGIREEFEKAINDLLKRFRVTEEGNLSDES